MKFGLRPTDIALIISTLQTCNEVDAAYLFGSRAKGNYRPGSDVDIALIGNHITFNTIARIKELLQEQSKMPYQFDIVDYTHCKSDALKAHIDAVGVLLFSKPATSE